MLLNTNAGTCFKIVIAQLSLTKIFGMASHSAAMSSFILVMQHPLFYIAIVAIDNEFPMFISYDILTCYINSSYILSDVLNIHSIKHFKKLSLISFILCRPIGIA